VYWSEYDIAFLKKVSEKIVNTITTNKAFIYFNNDTSGAAITNAKQMEEYIFLLKRK
jgi:uncharacterized protein YecE (DUF72 family)